MDSKIGLIVQLNGVILITILSLFLRRSLKLAALKYWTAAWLSLSVALISLRLAFALSSGAKPLFTVYFLAEYTFGFLLVAGCQSLDGEAAPCRRQWLYLVPCGVLAAILPQLAADFNDVFNVHAVLMAGFFAAAFMWVSRSALRSFGRRVMRVALASLALNFAFYAVAFSLRGSTDLFSEILTYNSVVDLVLQTSLGFGMVIVLLEKVLADSRTAHESLREAHQRLEELVHTDPLTAAFTRHAFYGFVVKNGENRTAVNGCVGFFDIDNLKVINDRYGHAAGDGAIRAVVRAIRELIRAEDLIFRWGGDEFFVVMVGMSASSAQARMARLDALLADIAVPEIADAVSVGVSFGFTDFAEPGELESAIAAADTLMYQKKQQRKSLQNSPPRFLPNAAIQLSETA